MSAQQPEPNLSEAAALLNTILASAETIRTLGNATAARPPPVASLNEDTLTSHLASLFPSRRQSSALPASSGPVPLRRENAPRYQTQQCFTKWTSGMKRKRARDQQHDHFNKDIILLPNPTWDIVCKQGPKQWLHTHGHILSAFEFHKTWDYQTVIRYIRESFGHHIPEDVGLQFLMACGNKLVSPKIQEGQELNGMLIHKVYKTKALYVRPSKTLLTESEEKYSSHILPESTSTIGTTASDGDDDVFEVDAPQNHTDTTSRITTRAITRSRIHNEDGNYDDCHETNPIVSSAVKRKRVMELNDKKGDNCGHETSNCGHIAGTSGPDGGNCASGDDSASKSSHGQRNHARSEGGAFPSGHDGGNSASSDGNPSTRSHDEDYSSYLTLTARLSDDFSEDEDLNLAIIASLESQTAEKTPVQEILLDLSSKINPNQQCRFNINRSAIWEGAVRGFRRVSYDPHSMICVKFSDDTGKNEEGVDLGGPRREFLRLLMESISRSPMLEGKENSKNLALCSTALREDWYYVAGRAIAVSLVHGGPPPNFLSSVMFSFLVNGAANPVLEDIADNELLEKVQKVSESSTIEELENSRAPLLDYLANAGCLRPLRSIRDKDLLVHDIVMFQVIHRVQGPFQRFCEGLKTLGVLEKIRSHPDSFRPLFCFEPGTLTADRIDDLFSIRLSPEGSNKRAAEEIVVTFWRDYLQDAEDEDGQSKLQKILAFTTGASEVPPIGFSPTPSVQFIHNGDEDFSNTPMFPIANTCVNCIKLPLHVSYQLFKEKFDFALGNTYGFGRA